jgi:hypothetical protein
MQTADAQQRRTSRRRKPEAAKSVDPSGWVLYGNPWWVHASIIVAAGAFGGRLNAILAGGPTYGVRLSSVRIHEDGQGRVVHLGVWGSMVVGVGASLAAWATGFHQTQVPAMIAGCFFAGLAGASYLSGRARQAATELELRNQQHTTEALLETLARSQPEEDDTESEL